MARVIPLLSPRHSKLLSFPLLKTVISRKKEVPTWSCSVWTNNNDNDKVAFHKKSLTQVCFALPSEDDLSKMTWIEVLCKSLAFQEKEVIMAQDCKGYTFEMFKEGNTSTTTGGMPFVQCYYGVKDGVLFPMKEGLLFFKNTTLGVFVHIVCISHIIVTHSLSLLYILYAEHQCFGIGLPYIPLRVHVDWVDRDT